MADSRMPTDVTDAVYRLVHDFGAERLARMTGTSPGVICNKANPHETTHHRPTLAEGIVWTNISQDMRIAQAFCRAVGGVFVSLDEMERQSDDALLDLVLAEVVREGDAARSLADVLQDGRVTRAEFEDLRRAELEAVAARLTVLQRVEGMVRG